MTDPEFWRDLAERFKANAERHGDMTGKQVGGRWLVIGGTIAGKDAYTALVLEGARRLKFTGSDERLFDQWHDAVHENRRQHGK